MTIDREKVIKGLECCKDYTGKSCEQCHLISIGACQEKLFDDARDLLKADQRELVRQRDIIAKLQAAIDLANGKLVHLGYETYNLDDGRTILNALLKDAPEIDDLIDKRIAEMLARAGG